METVQIALTNLTYRQALRDLLIRNGQWEVREVEWPDLEYGGVVVTDCEHLRQFPKPIRHPERVVLIASDEPGLISRAWDAGVNSVVPYKEPLSTAVLAVLSTTMRHPKTQSNIARS